MISLLGAAAIMTATSVIIANNSKSVYAAQNNTIPINDNTSGTALANELANGTDMYQTIYSTINMQKSLNASAAEKKSVKMSYDRAFTRITSMESMYIAQDVEAFISDAATIESRKANIDYTYLNDKTNSITPESGIYSGPSGKETYYNLPMGGAIYLMRCLGYSEDDYPYWIRDDGVKMFGDYVMVAADLQIRPKGTVLECSMGTAMVCDTGDLEPQQLDVAVSWT